MPESSFRVGVVEKNRASYWDMVNSGWHDAAERLGLELDIRAPEHENLDEQLAHMSDLLAHGVDAIAFVGTADGPFDELCQQARAAGTLVVTFDLDASRDHRTLFVGMVDPETMGRRLGDLVATAVGPGATVLLQSGSATARGAVGKLRGLVASLQAAGITAITSEPDGEDIARAHAISDELISAHPSADAAVGVYGYHPSVLAESAARSGSQIRIFGFDMLPETVELLRAGRVEASVWIREYEFGYFTAVAVADLLRLGSAEVLGLYGGVESGAGRSIELEPRVFTPTDLHEFEAWRDAHALERRTGRIPISIP